MSTQQEHTEKQTHRSLASAQKDNSFRSIETMETFDEVSQSFNLCSIEDRKPKRRVSWSENIETVNIIENLRLTLTNREKEMMWESPNNSQEFLIQQRYQCMEDALAQAFGNDDTPMSPTSRKSNVNSKRRRRKSRNNGTHSAQPTIFGDLSSAKSRKQRQSKTQEEPQSPAQPLVRCKKSPLRAQLKSITSRLGLRSSKSKKDAFDLPFRN